MATAVGTGFDISALTKSISDAEKKLDEFIKKGSEVEKALTQNFQNIAKNGINQVAFNIEKINDAIVKIGSTSTKSKALKSVNDDASAAVDKMNKFLILMSKINGDNPNGYRNSAITKVNEEIDSAKKRLEELNKLLQFYTKGEGKKAIGFVDTTETQKEAKALMWRIDALEREKASLQANARLRMQVAKQREQIANDWNKQEADRIKRVNQSAKEENKIRNQQQEAERKAHDERQKMYDQMGRKMHQQTNLDLGKEYELQEAERKKREASEEKLIQFAEKSAERRAKIQQKADADEHARLQKAWEEKQKQQQRELELIASSEDAKRKARDAQNAQNAKAASQIDANEEKLAKRNAQREAEEHKRKIDNINKRFDLIAKRDKREAQRQTEYLNSPTGALKYAKGLENGVKSINTMNQALQQLRNAQANVNTNTEEGRKKYNELGMEIKRVETEMRAVSGASDEVKKKHRKLMDTSGQLMRAMTAIFSVSAIKGYINKLREVRGEFEKQQRSLQILLQNKDKADELWEKTIDLAVKSPFRVKELVTYTKQLAAYRVESDKLYDTTKMLADVSAGLGVDMNRLILAFGQVKAANFLRGTELRQFTEAGIPMLDELAKLFTELEGRAVSAGDVFERISKRMVTFGDVEEVFNRITSAGGVFYKMQEEQSKTLAGLYSNLHDSIDLMLNDIGKANDGLLKGSINIAKEFVENWREVAYVLARIVAGLTAYKLSTAAFALGLKNTTNATLRFNNAMTWADAKAIGFTKTQFALTKALTATKIAANGVKVAFMQIMLPALLIGGLAKLVQMMTKANREAKRLKKDLNAIFNEDTSNLERQNDTFKDLVERLKDVNIGSKEHKNIISQLNNQYGEYLGFIVDEKTTYDQLASSINSVTTALTQKAKASSYEKALSRLYEDTGKDISDSMSKIEERFKSGFFRTSGPRIIPTDEEIQDIFALIQKEVTNTGKKIGDGLDLGSILSEYYGENVIFSATEQHKHLLEYSESILKQKREEEKIQNRINSLYDTWLYSTKEYRDEMEKLRRDKEEELSNTKSRSDREKIEYKYKVEEVRLQGRYEGLDDSAIQKRVDRIQKVSATVADINRRMGEEADKFGQDAIDRVYITFQDASQGVDAIAEQTAASYKSMQKEIKDQNALKEAGTIHDQKALDNATLMSKVYYRMLEIMGKTELAKEKGADSKELKRLKEQIKLIRDAANAYDDMRKLHDDAYASERIVKDYENAFKEAGLGDIEKYSFGTREDERNNLKKLEDSASRVKGGMLELSKAIAQVSVNIDDADKELSDKKLFDAISDIFSNYEISLEMDKLNIPSDLAQKLFGFESIDINDIRGKVLEKFGLGSMAGTSNQGIYDSAQFKAMSKERQDELRKSLEKEEELQDNALKERMNRFVKFLKDSMNEITVVQKERANDISFASKLFDEKRIDASTYTQVIKRLVHETNSEISKIKLEKFKESSTYIAAMGDLSSYSKKELQSMLNTLKDVVAQNAKFMSADEIKAYYESIDNINEAFEKLKMPWSNNNYTDIARILELEKQITEEKAKQSGLERQRMLFDTQLKQLETTLQTQQKNGASQTDISTTMRQISTIVLALQGVNGEINATSANISSMGSEMEGLTNGATGAITIVDKIIKEVYNSIEATKKMFDDIKALADSYGADTENESWSKWSSAMETVGNVNSEVMQGWENLKSGNFMGAIANTIGSITKLIQGINEFKDVDNEKEIERQQKRVENLEKAYGELEKAIEEAYNTDQIKANQAAMEQNINAQIDALEAAKVAEEDKKNTDTDAVDDYSDQIKELEDKKAELEREMVETMGGTYDYSSVAEQFLDAWLSAFEETGDGLSGLDQAFDDFWKNILKKQVVYQGASSIIKKYVDTINDALEDDSIIDTDEMNAIKDASEVTKAKLSEFFAFMQEQYGIANMGESELSGLSKGIQGITETQADILAAYWNAVRFDVSAIRQRFDDFMAMQGYGEEVNPVENHLKTISLNTTAILTLLGEAKTDSEANAIRVKVLNM